MRKLLLLLSILMFTIAAAAQSAPTPCSAIKPDAAKMKKPSPPACTDIQFTGGKRVVIQYSQPKINDPQTGKVRKVYGGLVPWGEPWRAGANEATSLVTDTDLTIGGTKVPAGSYTLYIQAEENGPWKLIVNKTTGQWGIPYPGEASDLARIDMKTSQLPKTVERLTMSLEKKSGNAAVLNVDWENTRASVPVSATGD
ncbi:MAG: DUF2911 domain-containing protein [Terriglobales bacterium]